MMKRKLLVVFLAVLLSGSESIKSQELSVREEIDYINSLLKAHPYRDTFLEITFFYSVDITSGKELIVKMEFDGPFKTMLKARIDDLTRALQSDTPYEDTGSVCWYCKAESSTGDNNCVYSESVTTGQEKESHNADNICVMFSNQKEIRDKLLISFDHLFKKVLEQ